MKFEVSALDSSIVIIYILFVVCLGFYFSRKHKNAEDYFLAGRSLTWPLIGFSLFASNMSSNSLIGLAGAGYADGFSVYSYEWMAVLVLLLFSIFFLPFYFVLIAATDIRLKNHNRINWYLSFYNPVPGSGWHYDC